MEGERIPFGTEEYIENSKVTKGVKLKNKTQPEKPKIPTREEFEQTAKTYFEQKKKLNTDMIDLVKQFYSFLEDKTLSENKKGLARDIEQDHRVKLINLIRLIDYTEAESEDGQEGVGTYSILSVILKAILIQRDKINELDYTVHKLKSDLSSLSERVGSIEKSEK